MEGVKRFSHLPLVRFSTVAMVLVALDSLVCVALWLSGGDSTYMEDSVTEFSFTRSVFDLACLAVVRGIVLGLCFYYLEYFSLMRVSLSGGKNLTTSRLLTHACRAGILLLSLASFVYAAVKGGFVIREMRHGTRDSAGDSDDTATTMHATYKALCIIAVAFPLLELCLGVVSWYYMWRLTRVQKLRLIVNATGDDIAPKKKSVNIRRLVLLAKPEWPLLMVGIFCLTITSTGMAVVPFLFGKVVEYATPGQTNCSAGVEPSANVTCIPYGIWRMNREVLLLVAVFVVVCVAAVFRDSTFNIAGERFVARLRKNLFASIISQEMGFFDKSRTGELTNRLASDTQVVQNTVTNNVSALCRYSLQMVISIAFMFYLSPKLTAVLLSAIPIIAVAAVQYGRFLKSIRKQFQDKLAHANSTADEAIANMATVRSFSSEGKMNKMYSTDINASYFLGRKLAFLSGSFAGVALFPMYGATCLVLWYGGFLVYHMQLQSGILIAILLYTLNLAMCFAFLSNLYGEFMQAVGASIRIFELLDRQSEVNDGTEIYEPFKGAISFERVQFSYPSRPEEVVLQDVSFAVEPGQVVALVGPSGGGKSTIVRLIEHFYDLTDGRVKLGGHDVKDLDPTWYRKHIGLVSQEPVLFACSIADNIRYGKEDASMEEIEEAARQANAHSFISSFQSGYDTTVGERGVRLSGGQKQRVAIARALLLNPEVLLLDEATSALDAESEHLVQEAIDRAMKGRTVLVIAHRLSTVKDASQIVVIHKGRVVEQGTHTELLARGGVYKQLVYRQLAAGDYSSDGLVDSK